MAHTPTAIHYDIQAGEQPGPDWTKVGELTVDVWTRVTPNSEGASMKEPITVPIH